MSDDASRAEARATNLLHKALPYPRRRTGRQRASRPCRSRWTDRLWPRQGALLGNNRHLAPTQRGARGGRGTPWRRRSTPRANNEFMSDGSMASLRSHAEMTWQVRQHLVLGGLNWLAQGHLLDFSFASTQVTVRPSQEISFDNRPCCIHLSVCAKAARACLDAASRPRPSTPSGAQGRHGPAPGGVSRSDFAVEDE